MTVLEVIQRSARFLQERGVDSPRLQVEWMLAALLSLPRLHLYLNFDRVLTPSELEQLRDWVRRRGQREPLQHILGSVSFCGIDLKTDSRALIPRPETELLAERGWRHLQSLAGEAPWFLDFGTGSGCVAIALALQCPSAQGVGLDASASALELAAENIGRHDLGGRIQLVHSRSLEHWTERRFDLVISNPPYIPTQEIGDLEPEVQRDPREALDGGKDGLDCCRFLAREASRVLRPDGKVLLEFGFGQERELAALFEAQGWREVRLHRDDTGRPRFLEADAPSTGRAG